MRTKVLLSIRPEFADKIFDGTKQYEYRRALFKSQNVLKILVYASSPVQKVVGEFEIEEILSLDPSQLWKRTQLYSGISKKYFDQYFQGKRVGHAIRVKKPLLYEKPLDLKSNYDIKQPPQSFAYLT